MECNAPRPASTRTNVPYSRRVEYLGKLCLARGKNPFYNADISSFGIGPGLGNCRRVEEEEDKIMLRDAVGA